MSIPVVLSTGSLFHFDVATIMALASETGYDGVELMVDWRQETQSPRHLQKLITQYDLPILAVHSPFTKMIVPDWPENPIESIKRSVKLAEEVGAKTVIVHPPGRWLRIQGKLSLPGQHWKLTLPLPVVSPGQLGEWLVKDLPAYQAGTNVKIAIENMPCRRLGPFRLNAHHFSAVSDLQQFQHLTLDTTHVGTRNWDLLAVYRQLAPKVAHLHLSNFNGREHQLPENGHLPLARLLDQMASDGFQGVVSLELGPMSLEAHHRNKLRQNLKSSLSFCRNYLQQAV